MTSVDKAIASQLENIQKRSGKTLAQLQAFVRKSGLTKHGEIRDLLKRELGMGHGDANLIATEYLKGAASPAPAGADVLDEIYAGAKAELRPVHEAVMREQLPLTMGGGIGQSRLCMLLLGKAHIGEVQVSLWDAETKAVCERAGVQLL